MFSGYRFCKIKSFSCARLVRLFFFFFFKYKVSAAVYCFSESLALEKHQEKPNSMKEKSREQRCFNLWVWY